MKSAGNHCAQYSGSSRKWSVENGTMPGVEPGVADVLDALDRRAARPDRRCGPRRPTAGAACGPRTRPSPRPRARCSSSRPPMTSTRAARRAVVDRQRQAPVALLADHPVVHVAEPVELALVAEVGDPADLVDDVHDLVAQARVDLLRRERLARLVVDRAHRDEPLVDEAEQRAACRSASSADSGGCTARGGRSARAARGRRRSARRRSGASSPVSQPKPVDVPAVLVDRRR